MTSEDQDATIALRELAELMDEMAASAARLKLTIRELQRFSSEYQAMARDLAEAARDFATAVDANDADRSSAAQMAIHNAISREDPIVDGINQFCLAH